MEQVVLMKDETFSSIFYFLLIGVIFGGKILANFLKKKKFEQEQNRQKQNENITGSEKRVSLQKSFDAKIKPASSKASSFYEDTPNFSNEVSLSDLSINEKKDLCMQIMGKASHRKDRASRKEGENLFSKIPSRSIKTIESHHLSGELETHHLQTDITDETHLKQGLLREKSSLKEDMSRIGRLFEKNTLKEAILLQEIMNPFFDR